MREDFKTFIYIQSKKNNIIDSKNKEGIYYGFHIIILKIFHMNLKIQKLFLNLEKKK